MMNVELIIHILAFLALGTLIGFFARSALMAIVISFFFSALALFCLIEMTNGRLHPADWSMKGIIVYLAFSAGPFLVIYFPSTLAGSLLTFLFRRRTRKKPQ
jgi:uncharacterized membrane protein YhaH (DUF805 family)